MMALHQAGSAPRRVRGCALAALAVLAAGACDRDVATPEPVIAAITVAPAPATVGMGGVLQFTATAVDENGQEVRITPVWSVAGGGGTIGASSGIFTAGTTPGTFASTVRATVRGVTGTATVNVTGAALASITVTPNPASVALNGSLQFTATGRDAAGNTVAVTPTWSVVAGGGTITPNGNFIAGSAAGTFTNTVQATAGGVTGSATVQVTAGTLARITIAPNPATVGMGGVTQFTATGFDQNGAEVRIAPEWSVVAGGGTIAGSSGIFTAGAVPGGYVNTVRATVGGVSSTATVNVPATALQVSPPVSTVGQGGTVQFTATALDAQGNRVPVPVAWSVVGGGGTIDAGGLFTAGTAAGSFGGTVRAETAGATAFADVTVAAGTLATVTVTPDSLVLAVTRTAQFTATGRDANGNVIPINPVWSVANGGGTITPNGLFTAGNTPGHFSRTVRATAGGVQGAATVTVTTGPVATFAITPSSAQVIHHQAQQFTATARDASGNVIPVTPTWSVSAGGGAITQDGLYTAGGTLGAFSVQAAIPGRTASAQVTVTPGPLASVTVTPNPATVRAQQSLRFAATGRDADGYPVPITPVWSVVNGGGHIVSNTATFFAGGTVGTFTNTVRATAGGLSGFATVNVAPGGVSSITVTPNPAFVVSGQTVQFTAVGRDINGNVTPITPTWSVDNGGGTIDPATGVFTGGAPGPYPYTVRATFSGVSSSRASVNVTAAQPDRVVVVPGQATVCGSCLLDFSLMAVGVNGDSTFVAPVTWGPVRGGAGYWEFQSAGMFRAGNTPGTFVDAIEGIVGEHRAYATVTMP